MKTVVCDEVYDLRAEIELLKEEAALWQDRYNHRAEGDGIEIERLTAANERLRAALQSLTHDPPASLAREPDTDCEVILKMRAIARAALEPKP